MTMLQSKGIRAPRSVALTLAALTIGGLSLAVVGPAHAGIPVDLIASSATSQGAVGTIKGRLVWGGPEAPAPKVLVAKGQAQKDSGVCASQADLLDHELVVDPKTKGVRYAFVYLVRPKGSNPDAVKALVANHPAVEIDQKNCEFLPYVTALHREQSILFKSSDPVNHNVHVSPFTNEGFNLILPPNGQLTKKLVAERRVIPLGCDIHPWMKGWIMVFDHPFFAVTEPDGSFEIKGVPAGEQNLVVWQAAVGYANEGLGRGMPVPVEAGRSADVGDLKLDPARVKAP